MKDKEYKSKGQLLDELIKLRYRIAESLKSETEHTRAKQAPKLRRHKVKSRK